MSTKGTTAKKSSRYVGRFAPSPTGPLHVGSLCTALASYADAKHAGGEWLLRFEDVDEHRTVNGAREKIMQQLAFYGFEWDREVAIQSQRKALYRAALERLVQEGRVFVCKCSRKDLSAEPLNISGEPFYPGTCKDKNYADFGHVGLRFHAPEGVTKWTDLHFGPQKQTLKTDVGDFVVRRTDGLFSYQLAVVVDDAEQGVTRVVRGADLLTSTARQIALQKALKLPTPEYLHIPIIVNGRGEKLSKSTFSAALSATAPVPVLLTAWKLLGQTPPEANFSQPRDFLQYAAEHWDIKKLPRTMMVPYLAV